MEGLTAVEACVAGVKRIAPKGALIGVSYEAIVYPDGQVEERYQFRVGVPGGADLRGAGPTVHDAASPLVSKLVASYSNPVMDIVTAKVHAVIRGEGERQCRV